MRSNILRRFLALSCIAQFACSSAPRQDPPATGSNGTPLVNRYCRALIACQAISQTQAECEDQIDDARAALSDSPRTPECTAALAVFDALLTCRAGASCSDLAAEADGGPVACLNEARANDSAQMLCATVQANQDGGSAADGGRVVDGGSAGDGGHVVDGGSVDDGGHVVDGGSVGDGGHVVDGGFASLIGGACINSGSGQIEQSTCNAGLLCLPLSQENATLTICTKDCVSNFDCGAGSSCWSGICWQNCSGPTGACIQSDFSCQTGFVQNTNLCLPDCRTQARSFCNEFFGYPFNACDGESTAAQAQGSCGSAGSNATCSQTMACTGSGEACYTIPGGASSVCVDDCTLTQPTCFNDGDCASDKCVSGRCAPCPSGLACDSNLRTCKVTPVSNYGACAPSASGACPTGSNCIKFGSDLGQCLPACASDFQCPSPSMGNGTPKCALDLNDGSKVCSLDCSAAGAVCPQNTACAQISELGSFCFPSNAP